MPVSSGDSLGQSHDWSGDVAARFNHWVGQFYADNLDQILGPAISGFGKDRIGDLLTELTAWVRRRAAEQFSQSEIEPFLTAVADERQFDEVQQFCGQIVECQQLWSILTECPWSLSTECEACDGAGRSNHGQWLHWKSR